MLGIDLVSRNFAQNKIGKVHAIMDLIFYSRRKVINEQQRNEHICTC